MVVSIARRREARGKGCAHSFYAAIEIDDRILATARILFFVRPMRAGAGRCQTLTIRCGNRRPR